MQAIPSEEERGRRVDENRAGMTEHTVALRFKEWMRNFHYNMQYIRRDLSIIEMPKADGRSCLIIGGGPSIERYGHLSLLARSKFRGHIFCCDKMLKTALQNHVKPTYTVNDDSSELAAQFILGVDDPALALCLTTAANPKLRRNWRGPVYWFTDDIATCAHRFGVGEALGEISNTPVISSGGNVGGTAIMLAHMAGYSPIALIGFDLSYDESIPLDQTPYYGHFQEKDYFRGRNPYWGNEYVTDPVFELYRQELLGRIQGLKIPAVNCSGRGALTGIPSENFALWLKKHNP